MFEKIPAPTPRENLRALIIDSQNLVHSVIRPALHSLGVSYVTSAFNEFHAKRLYHARHYDIVFLSFNVSRDKDGFHLFEELKYLNFIKSTTTVVFLSAETSTELVNCVVELQPDDFWVKPLKRSLIQQRLNHLLQIKFKLHKMLYCMQANEYSSAMYYAERQLTEDSLKEYHPRIRRLIGNCLIKLHDYEGAQRYFETLSYTMKQGWVSIGLANALLLQDKLEEAQDLIDKLVTRRDTRFLTYDLLAQYFIEKGKFDLAYEQTRQASKLAPRNMERNKRLWELARLNHDYLGQLSAVKSMEKNAKNSIHDSPQLLLNVIRTTIDVATTSTDEEAEQYLRAAELEIKKLSLQPEVQKRCDEQLSILKARVLCCTGKKNVAEAMIKDFTTETHEYTLEDNLDKMKAFHELGLREKATSVLNGLKAQLGSDSFRSIVVSKYLEEESHQREEIHFTTKELKGMAATNYKKSRLLPTFTNLYQAFTLSPRDKKIAFNLLKVMVELKERDELENNHLKVTDKVMKVLLNESLTKLQRQSLEQYAEKLDIDLHADKYEIVTGVFNRKSG